MQPRTLLLYYSYPSSLIALLYLALPIPSESLLLFRSNNLHGVPSPSPPSPSKWLAKILWDDGRNISEQKSEIKPWLYEKNEDDKEEISKKETKHRPVSFLQSLLRVRSFLLVQAIRLVLLCHIEGPVLRRLPNKVLFEIVHECLKEEARPFLLRVVATELDRRRQDYEFGDVSRYTWGQFTKSWRKQFGKEYQFGDITRGVLERAAQVAESEVWKNRLQEEMEGLQKEWDRNHRKWRLVKVRAFRKKRD